MNNHEDKAALEQNILESVRRTINEIKESYGPFIKRCTEYLITKYPEKYNFRTKNQKYSAETIVTEIIHFSEQVIPYSKYRGPVHYKTLNKHILFMAKHSIFENVYNSLYSEYIKADPSVLDKLFIDNSIIVNINGQDQLGRCVLCKWKNCYKLSILADRNRIPASIVAESGDKHDVTIGYQNVNDLKRIEQIKDHKPYIVGDKGYDSDPFKQYCKRRKFKPITDYNKRKTKDPAKIKTLTNDEQEIYKERAKVENSFCLLKKFKRVQQIYELKKSTFISFVYLVYGLILSRLKIQPVQV
jgi:hypothetical protein